MNIFRQLRWRLTLNYTLVTVCAFLVVVLILAVIFLPIIFVQTNNVDIEGLIQILEKNTNPLFSHILSQSPVDTELIQLLLKDSNSQITSFDVLRIGSVQFTVRTMATFRVLIIGPDGTLLGKTENDFPANYVVGQSFDLTQVQGLEAPFQTALTDWTNLRHLYTIYEPNERYVLAVPIFKTPSGAVHQVAGVVVVFVDKFPTQADVPSSILNITASSLLIFLVSIVTLGTIFGILFAHGLAKRFQRVSSTIDAWSEGNFATFIDDTAGDEISKFTQQLNNMAKQLRNLLRRRQEMAVSEERNRLARDLHDSAKQQALAASFQLGTALTLYESDPKTAKKHLVEADTLVDSVRNELTNLVQKLRPQPQDGKDFSETLRDYVVDWSHRSAITVDIDIEGDSALSVETREALFRITQEALANIARHSSARHADLSLEYGNDKVKMTIKDNGHGFDPAVRHRGLGLSSMRERAEVLGGSFSIKSSAEKGTRIVVTLPQKVT